MIVTTVMPRRDKALSVFIIDEAEVASSPDVGSSRNNAIGAAANSMPMLTRLRSPPEMTGLEGLPTSESLM